jgi:hypothetical protein
MFLTRRSIPRRTFLRGVGAGVALPHGDAQITAQKQAAHTPA